jgi:hypothetical protein
LLLAPDAGSTTADARTTSTRDARRRDGGRTATTDARPMNDAGLRPFDGRTPVVVTSPKDVGR